MRTVLLQDDSDRYPPHIILPVTEEDARPISVFAFEAVEAEPLSSYLYPTRSDRANYIKRFEESVLSALNNPSFISMKSVDRETGEVASYAIWERVTSSGPSQNGEQASEGRDLGTTPLWLAAAPRNTTMRSLPMLQFVNSELAKFRESWAKDMNYIELQSLATSLRFQRRGHATALLQWGHAKANAEKQVCFLLGSPAGRPLYASLGWKEVGHIVVDMKDWVPGGERGDQGWGVWKVYHMVRLPRAVT